MVEREAGRARPVICCLSKQRRPHRQAAPEYRATPQQHALRSFHSLAWDHQEPLVFNRCESEDQEQAKETTNH